MVSRAVKAYFLAIRETKVDAWLDTFAADAVTYDPADAPPHRGRDELRKFFEGIAGAFKEVGLYEDSVFIVGNQAAVKWTGRGTGKNGRKVHFEGIDIFDVNDEGKIQGIRAYWNPLELMGQLQG
jgi:steroid delta-isomerase